MKKNRENRDLIEGNTSLQSNQLKKWFFTWNNYDVSFLKTLETRFFEICEKGLYQSEVGDEGTPHLQGGLWLKEPMRWTEFGLPKGIHWEKMKSEKGSMKYCNKTSKDGWDGLYRWSYNMPKPLKIIDKLYDWQKLAEEYCLSDPDGRKVKWIWDEIGSKGKSAFCKYMVVKYNAVCIQGGKLADIMNIIFNTDMDCVNAVIIDIPRCNKNGVSYASIECILNGMITNTKYETGRKIFNPPNVLVLSNFYPDITQLSQDRWDITDLNENISENP
jgi:hypothetical protein